MCVSIECNDISIIGSSRCSTSYVVFPTDLSFELAAIMLRNEGIKRIAANVNTKAEIENGTCRVSASMQEDIDKK